MSIGFRHIEKVPTQGHVGLALSEVEFSDNTKLSMKRDSIIIITGPNNSGKSKLLREISLRESQFNMISIQNLVVCKKILFDFYGTTSDVCSIAKRNTLSKGNEGWFSQLALRNLSIGELLQQQNHINEPILQALFTYMNTSFRLLEMRTSPIQSHGISFGGSGAPTFLRRIHENKGIEKRIDEIVYDLFGLHFLLNRFSYQDSRPHLLFQKIPDHINTENDEIARWFESQPLLEQQGDGVTAFCGIVGNILSDPKPLIVLDEPELFLHPPQIRQLAKIIAKETPRST